MIDFILALIIFTGLIVYFWMDDEVKKGERFMRKHFPKEGY